MTVGPLDAFPTLALPRPGTLLRAAAAALLAERERWPLWLPVGFASGIGLYFALPFEPESAVALAAAALGLGAGIAAARTRSLALSLCLWLVASFMLGGACAKLHTALVAAPVLDHRVGPAVLSGRIEQVERRDKGARIVLGDLHVDRLAPERTPLRARLSLRVTGAEIVPGGWVSLKAALMPPPAPAAPGSYDFGRAAYYQGIGAVGFAFGRAHAVAPARAATLPEQVETAIELLRARMTARIRAVLPGSNGAIAAALITGERGGIDPADTDAYRDAGIAHVLSISGLHLALAGGFFFWLLRAVLAAIPSIALRHPIKKWAALAALGGATFYLLISGCDAPAVRSYIMLAIMFCAILADRPALTMRNVALSAVVILAVRPQSLTEPGFEMSFAAVIGLIALAEWQQARRAGEAASGPATRFRRYWTDIALATLIASLATAPFALYHFERSSQYGLLANLLTVPLTGFIIMPGATAAMVAMPFGLERLPLIVMGKGVAAMTAVAHFVAGLPNAASLAPAMPQRALLLLVAGGLWMALWRRRWRWLGLIPAALGVVLAMTDRGPDILVARDASTVAVRSAGGALRFVRTPRDVFSAGEWLKRDGDRTEPKAALGGPPDGMRCDGYGCIAMRGGWRIAAVLRPDALAEDCARAQILVSAVPVGRRCSGPLLAVDRFDVLRNGAYAVWLGPALRVETVEGERGMRPWSAQPRERRQYRRIRPTSLPWTRTRSAP